MQRCCACRAEVAPGVLAEEGAVGGADLRGHWHFECSFFGLFWGGWLVWKSEWFGGGGGSGGGSEISG